VYSFGLFVVLLGPGFIYNKEKSFTPKGDRAYLTALSGILDQYSKPTDKIMVNDGSFSPTVMYWAKRKGWSVNQDVPSKTEWMDGYRKQGLKYIVMDRNLSDEKLPYILLYEDGNIRVYGFE